MLMFCHLEQICLNDNSTVWCVIIAIAAMHLYMHQTVCTGNTHFFGWKRCAGMQKHKAYHLTFNPALQINPWN